MEHSSSRAPVPEGFAARRLEQVFDGSFADNWRTKLVGGAQEPFYQPAAADTDFHLLHYRSDYFASALHEIAHWCIAGPRRRQLPDFGYWYAPDGRNAAQQAAFEVVEYQPQALEWFFSRSCGYRFCISVDNLDASGELPDDEPFRRRVFEQATAWQTAGLPLRAAIFFTALSREFNTRLQPELLDFSFAELTV